MTTTFLPVHRRLAELYEATEKRMWTIEEATEMMQCMRVAANFIRKNDELNELSRIAYEIGDMDWLHEVCAQIEKLQSKMMAF